MRRFAAREERWEEPVSEDDCVFCKIVRGEMEAEVVQMRRMWWPSRT